MSICLDVCRGYAIRAATIPPRDQRRRAGKCSDLMADHFQSLTCRPRASGAKGSNSRHRTKTTKWGRNGEAEGHTEPGGTVGCTYDCSRHLIRGVLPNEAIHYPHGHRLRYKFMRREKHGTGRKQRAKRRPSFVCLRTTDGYASLSPLASLASTYGAIHRPTCHVLRR